MSATHKSESRLAGRLLANQNTHTSPDFHCSGAAVQAAQVIEGESYAVAFLDRLKAGTAQRGELAMILAFLPGAMFAGACHVVENALEGLRHG